MKITELLEKNKDKITVSFEFIPPKKGISREEMLKKIEPLMEFNPLFVDVTTHRDDIVFKREGRNIEGYSYQRHPSTLVVCESIRNKFPNVEVVPHILCGGFSRQETEDVLLNFDYLGYDNVVALTGDKLSYEKYFTPHPRGNNSSIDLIEQIKSLNQGDLVGPSVATTNFCIGAACYPEGHYSSPNMAYEDERLKQKVGAGANFLISQMCFNLPKLISQRVVCDELEAPLIPGIKVLTNKRQLTTIPSSFFVEIPQEWETALHNGTHIEEAIRFCKSLIAHDFRHLHFYTMNSDTVIPVLKEIL